MNEYFGDKVKLIVSEIDGVITDGTYAEDEMGHVLYKRFNAKDFSAINEIKRLGYTFVFLAEDNNINYNMCRRKNIPFYWAKNEKEKYTKLIEIMRRYNCTPDDTVFIASRVSDKKCAQMIPKSICPEDAGHYLGEICWAEFTTKGGQGICSELLYLLKNSPKND
jgi:3-deoxy-D-manno-octulosonate 8-phosphate phosphatase KdsC-like HAD superfamily phosphatase